MDACGRRDVFQGFVRRSERGITYQGLLGLIRSLREGVGLSIEHSLQLYLSVVPQALSLPPPPLLQVNSLSLSISVSPRLFSLSSSNARTHANHTVGDLRSSTSDLPTCGFVDDVFFFFCSWWSRSER